MKALVFAAGLGTRLKPLTDSIPKALVQVGGEPLLSHVMRKLEAAGIEDIVVNVHHFADLIINYLREQDGFGTKVFVSDERDLLRETGGGIRHARQFLEGDGPFLVPVVQVNIPGQVVEARLVVEVCKLAGGIDVLTYLDFGGNQDVMVGHGKGEGIDVLGIVGERALEGVASVRC